MHLLISWNRSGQVAAWKPARIPVYPHHQQPAHELPRGLSHGLWENISLSTQTIYIKKINGSDKHLERFDSKLSMIHMPLRYCLHPPRQVESFLGQEDPPLLGIHWKTHSGVAETGLNHASSCTQHCCLQNHHVALHTRFSPTKASRCFHSSMTVTSLMKTRGVTSCMLTFCQ